MSEYEGQPLKDMNPFSNNRPRLTASERIRNKRDAAIYEAEKKQFQESKKKCGNRNVRFYKNGKIKSMKSYKFQKSLARGNILCNDCDNNGSFCKIPINKDDFNPIKMGNNSYSEFWGGATLVDIPGGADLQALASAFIISDISGVWGGSLIDVPKADLSNAEITTPIYPIPMPFGYVNNLITNPRNLDGSGIIIDPSNILFPDELCDPFRYLKHSYLKTYLVVTSAMSIYEKDVLVPLPGGGVLTEGKHRGVNCFDSSLNSLGGRTAFIAGNSAFGPGIDLYPAFGVVSSICCIGTINELIPFPVFNPLQKGEFGLFKIYIEISYLDEACWARAMKRRNNLPFTPGDSSLILGADDVLIKFQKTGQSLPGDITIWPWMQESLNIIQGSIPPSQNQSKYNATEKSYMACLENGTHGINFTKQNTIIPVKNALCSTDISGNAV